MSRGVRAYTSGRGQAYLTQGAESNIFQRLHSGDARDADQTQARKFGNQLSYANPNYSYDGKAAPSFYGYSGMGYGGVQLGFTTSTNITNFTPTIFIMREGEPWTFQKWNYVDSAGTLQPNGFAEKLQDNFLAVPTPDPERLAVSAASWPSKLVATGTDKEICVYRPATGEYWECYGFDKAGATPEQHTFQNAGYVANLPTFSGWFDLGPEGWIHGARATGLLCYGGSITMQDLVEVLRGGKIKHALSIGILVAKGPSNGANRDPAKRNDVRSNPTKFLADGFTPNPAFGTVDEIEEGGWYVFPAASHASDFGITGTIAVAAFEAIRDYGLVPNDVSGATTLSFEVPISIGSPYSWAKVNPFAGFPFATGDLATVLAELPASWKDDSLPTITEHLSGPESFLAKQPWKELELLAPFTS